MSYHRTSFDIEDMPISGYESLFRKSINLFSKQIFETARRVTENVVYYLPKSLDHDQMQALAKETIEIEMQHLNGRLVCASVYFGQLVQKSNRK